jgi:hypothetical protein
MKECRGSRAARRKRRRVEKGDSGRQRNCAAWIPRWSRYDDREQRGPEPTTKSVKKRGIEEEVKSVMKREGGACLACG